MTEWITVKDKKEDQIEKKVENEWIKKKIKPKENRAVFFNPSIEHCSSTCTDEKRRITINVNYL